MKPPLEKDVLAACLQLLRLRNVMAWRSSNHGVRRTDVDGRQFHAFHGLKGCADILAVIPPGGRLLAVECKRPGGKPTAAQEAFLAAVRASGGIALVVDDVAQLMTFLDDTFFRKEPTDG